MVSRLWIESSATGATLDGIRFNSMSASGAACSGSVDGFHLEYVRVQETQNVTIRNSTFVPDAGSGNGAGSGKIFVTSSSASSSAANGLKLIGNNFGTVKGSYSIQTHPNVQNANGWQIKNNTFAQPVMSPNLHNRRSMRQHRPRRQPPGKRPADATEPTGFSSGTRRPAGNQIRCDARPGAYTSRAWRVSHCQVPIRDSRITVGASDLVAGRAWGSEKPLNDAGFICRDDMSGRGRIAGPAAPPKGHATPPEAGIEGERVGA